MALLCAIRRLSLAALFRCSAELVPPVISSLGLLVLAGIALYAQTPQPPEDLYKAAVAAHQAGKLDEAIASYRKLLDQYPNIAQVRSHLGAALAAEGDYTGAIAEYKRALEIQPDAQVRLNLGLAYYKEGDFPAAIGQFVMVRDAAPGNIQAVLLLGDCYLRTGDNKKVIDLISPLRRANPNDLALTYMLGMALLRDGQSAEGQLVIDQILKSGDSAEARMLMGTTKFYIKDFAGARTDLAKAVELNPELPDVYSYYGLSLLTTGDQAGAQKAFRKALQQDPNNFDSNLRLGVLLRQDQQFEEALKYLKQALRVRPGDPGVRYQMASVEVALGQNEEARTHLEQLVRDAPNFEEAHVTLATVYYRAKRKEDGDRERLIAVKLAAEKQAEQPGAKPVDPLQPSPLPQANGGQASPQPGVVP